MPYMIHRCRCGKPDCDYFDPEAAYANLPDGLKPRTGGVITFSMITGIVVGIVSWWYLLDHVRTMEKAIFTAAGIAGIIIVLGYSTAYCIRDRAGWKARLMAFAFPLIAILIAPFSIWADTDQEMSIADAAYDTFIERTETARGTAWWYVDELTKTLHRWPDDHRMNDNDTDGIDTRSYTCSDDIDYEIHELFLAYGYGPALEEWEEKDLGGGPSGVWSGEMEGRSDYVDDHGHHFVHIDARARNRVFEAWWTYLIEVAPDGDRWCVAGAEYVGP